MVSDRLRDCSGYRRIEIWWTAVAVVDVSEKVRLPTFALTPAVVVTPFTVNEELASRSGW